MKQIGIILLCSFFFFSCGNKEEKKELENESEKILQPVVKDYIDEDEKTKVVETDEKEIENPNSNSRLIFTVQIAALRFPNKQLANLPNVNLYQENSLTKYRIGEFETYLEAKKYRKQISKKYKGAFVQALKNKTPIAITEALQ